MIIERTVTVDQSDPNRGRFDPSRVGKPNPADTEPRPSTSPKIAEATRAELAELRRRMTRAGGGSRPAGSIRPQGQPPGRLHGRRGRTRRDTMPDGPHDAHVPLSAEGLDAAERRALIAAVAEARADPHPPIPHEEVRAEIMAEIEEMERRIAALLAVPPA